MSGTIVSNRCAAATELVTISSPWKYNGERIRLTCHEAVAPRLKFAMRLAYLYSRFKPKRIDSFNCRPIRGSSTISNHGKGAAWDIFATPPTQYPPGGVWKPDETFGEMFALAFKLSGFTWGKYWTREDWPHIEWSSNYVPPLDRAARNEIKAKVKAEADKRGIKRKVWPYGEVTGRKGPKVRRTKKDFDTHVDRESKGRKR